MISIVAALLATSPLVTVAEQSGFTRTGRYDEVVALCSGFAVAYPQHVRCDSFGTTPEGRDLKALVVAKDLVRARERPVILVQGGIHAGEIDGKDAGFWFLRELLDGKVAKGALADVTFVFVPVYNVDGHERMSKNNRPNQRGPVEMGWRTTSWNLNLNRDYLKAEAPETQSMIRLLRQWNPVLYVDLHVTDGAQFQHDIAVLVDAPRDRTGALLGGAAAMQRRVIAVLNQGGRHHALDFYPSFEKDDDPSSGFSVGVAPPRFSQPYWALHGGIGMLVETHSWKSYRERVTATHDLLVALFDDAKAHVKEWRAPPQAPTDIVLAWENTDEKKTIDFLGYRYTRELSPISGALRTSYDERTPEVWRLPLLTGLKPALLATVPKAYLVPAGHASWIKAKLDLHGVGYLVVDKARSVDVESFRATEVTFGDKPYEGRTTAKVKGAWSRARVMLKANDLLVDAVPLAVHLFEPQAPDSLLSWGYFNGIFEQKEYMEPYVAEAVAAEMMKDPGVRAEFLSKLEDPGFAASASKRLDFFYRKHASYDAQRDVYPVLRVVEQVE